MDPLSIFLSGIKAWAPTAVSGLLIPIILWLINQLQKNEKDDAARTSSLKKEIAEQNATTLKCITEQLEKFRLEVEQRFKEHERRICILEQDAVKREEYFKTTSGWRTELNRLSDLVMAQMASTMDKIIELWRERKDET